MKKILSLILAVSLLLTIFPAVTFAGDADPVPTLVNYTSTRSNGAAQNGALFVWQRPNDGSNYRVTFLKFDFSNFTDEQIRKIDDVSLKLYATSDYTYPGLQVAVLPDTMENWDNTLAHGDAKNAGMLGSMTIVGTDETNKGQNLGEYKTVSGLGDAIVEHLMNNPGNKTVALRVQGIDDVVAYFHNALEANPPKLDVTFLSQARLPKATIVDGSSTRGTAYYDNQVMGTTIYTQANSSSNTRYAFYKFDFSAFSTADLYRVKDMTLNLYYNGTSPYTGVKVAVLPSDMEDWTSASGQDNTLASIYAHNKGMISVPAIAENTDNLDSSELGWKPVSGLGQAIVSHLLSDTDDKIVSFRVEAYQGTVPCEYTGIAHNASIQPYISATPVASEAEYLETVSAGFDFTKISSEPMYAVTSDLNFALAPLTSDTTLSITSSDENVISAEGVVNTGLEAKHATVTATIASVSDPSVAVVKSYDVTVVPNDGGDTFYYWDFENNKELYDYYKGTSKFMSGHTRAAAIEADPENASNKVAVVEDVTMIPDDYLTWISVPSTAKYIAFRADMYLENSGEASIVARDGSSNRIVIAQPNPTVAGEWQSLLTVLDIANPADSARYRKTDGNWSYYENVSLKSYGSFCDALGTIERLTIFGNQTGKAYLDNVSLKAYDDFYKEVNAATEANVIDVIDSFINMGIISLSKDYATADKAALAANVKANVYASDEEVTLAIDKFVSSDAIIINNETITANTLTAVKFALKAPVANAKLIVASYGANDRLLGVNIVDLASASQDAYTTVSGLNLTLDGAVKRKYMIWADVDSTYVPSITATELN